MNLDYSRRWEHCQYGWKEGASHYMANDATLTTVLQDDTPDTSKMSKEQLKEIVDVVIAKSDVLYFDKPSKSKLHPTMKPVELF